MPILWQYTGMGMADLFHHSITSGHNIKYVKIYYDYDYNLSVHYPRRRMWTARLYINCLNLARTA